MPSVDLHEYAVIANGIRLWLAEGPNAGRPPVVFLHGIYDRWESWSQVVTDFAGNFRVVVPDLRGHARSDQPAAGYELRDHAADMIGLLDALSIERAAIVGHSLGALIAATVAAGSPERVRAVVLEDPPLRMGDGTASMFRLLLDIKNRSETETYEALREIYWHRDEAEWRRMTAWLRETADGPFQQVIEQASQGATFFSTLEGISCPVLLLQADPKEGAALSDTDAALALESLSNAAGAELQRFAETGHVIHRERPDAFSQVVRAFLH